MYKRQITTSVPEVPTDDNHLFQVVECMPEFPGGMKRCMDFIQKEMRYPEEAKNAGIQGRVILQFIIEKDGTPAQPRIVRSVHPLLDKEALQMCIRDRNSPPQVTAVNKAR